MNTNKIESGNITLDLNEKLCYINNEAITLTKTEFNLLTFLMTNKAKIFTRNELVNNVWDDPVSERAVDANITRLRKKLGNYSNHIVTRNGFGYGFKE